MTNINIRADNVKLLIKDSFERSAALREQAFVKKIGTVKPRIFLNSGTVRPAAGCGIAHNSDYLLSKILAAA